jgi:hypothetical protein
MSFEHDYRVLGAQNAAQNLVDRIDTALGYPNPATGTLTYAGPEEREDGKWCVLIKRDVDLLVNVGGSTKERFDRRTEPGKRMKSEVDSLIVAPPQGAKSGIVERPGAAVSKAARAKD